MTSSHPARRLWQLLEPVHAVVYFGPQVRAAGETVGLVGFWMTYFAFRAAPLGAVPPAVVDATFGNFAPPMVARAVPECWTRATPAACLAARSALAAGRLRELGLADDVATAVAGRLRSALPGADVTGRPLGAANLALAWPDDPVAALWQAATTIRELRGDGHVAALVAAGVSGLQAHVLQAAAGRFTADRVRLARGWSDEQWEQASTAVRDRGLMEGADLTATGRDLVAEVERRTDETAWVPAGTGVVADVEDALTDVVTRIWSSEAVPAGNPIGIAPG